MTTSDRTIAGPQGPLRIRIDAAGGAGSPILLLHSDAGRLEQWDEVAELLVAEGRAVARFDFRGHGGSGPATDGDYSYAGRASDVLAVLDELGWDRVLLIAHSGGNGCALASALARPDRIAAILMVDPPTDSVFLPDEIRTQFVEGMAGAGSLEYLREYYRTIAGDDPAVVDRVLDDAGYTTADARAGLAPALLSWAPELVDRISADLRVIGTDVTDNPASIIAERPGIPHTVVHGTGHWVNIESPDAVVRELAVLLSEDPPAAG